PQGGIGMKLTALPGVSCKMWKGAKRLHGARLVDFGGPVLSDRRRFGGRRRRWLHAFHEVQRALQFYIGGCTLKQALVKLTDAILALVDFSGQRLGALDHERAVHEKKRLLWDGCQVPRRGVQVRVGEVEGPIRRREKLTVDIAIHRTAARSGPREQLCAMATYLAGQLTGGG